MSILLVEDDERMASFLAKGLRAEGYVPVVATNAAEALALADRLEEDLDLALLDLALPDRDGMEVLRAWRARRLPFPVIVLTAKDDLAAKVAGLDVGANDYVTKPFSFDELLARIRAARPSSRWGTCVSISSPSSPGGTDGASSCRLGSGHCSSCSCATRDRC